MPINAKDVLKRYKRQKSDRSNWDSLWQELADYIVPRKNFIITKPLQGGSRQTNRLFDSTAIFANERLASTMQGTLTSSAFPWFSLKMRSEELNEVEEVKKWLEESSSMVLAALRQSNFESEMQELYLDIGGFGTGGMFIGERELERSGRFPGFRFRAMPVGNYTITEDEEGRVVSVFYEFELSVTAAEERFGKTNLSDDSQRKLDDDNKKDDKIKILHAVFRRPGINENQVTVTTPSRLLPWASLFIEIEKRKKLQEKGYHEFPFIVPRWAKAPGETYGRGPGMTALPDIRTLNRAVDLRFRAWAKAVDPPLSVIDRAVIGRVRLTPASINPTRSHDAIREIITQSRFDVSNVNEDRLIQSILRIFFHDLVQFRRKEGTPISATEAGIIFSLMERLLGPTLGRIRSEALAPLVNRLFRMMLRAGVLPRIPNAVLRAVEQNQAQIDVRYEGPLARAQRSAEVEAVEAVAALLLPLREAFPDIMDIIDADEMARGVAEQRGLPQRFIRSKASIVKIRSVRQEAQRQEREAANMERAAQALGKAGPGLRALGGLKPDQGSQRTPGIPQEAIAA